MNDSDLVAWAKGDIKSIPGSNKFERENDLMLALELVEDKRIPLHPDFTKNILDHFLGDEFALCVIRAAIEFEPCATVDFESSMAALARTLNASFRQN